ncbi:MAG: GtrA family protein [Sphingobacteriales bacterium]|jgi:putative flippase GtrA|nr:GtrA family protein [Sphingobacteriales bacterium]
MHKFVQHILDNKLFRYFLSAGLATWVDVLTYFLVYNYLYKKTDIVITNGLVVASTTASLLMSYTAGLLTNFTLTKWLVFKESELETHKQLFRYVLVAMLILALNWMLMRVLIRNLEWYPTLSRAASALFIGFLSFFIHRVFSFRVKS